MDNGLFDLIPALMADEGADPILKDVTIDRITTNKSHDAMRIYMSSPKLIRKSRIYRLEDEIKRHLYPGKRMQVHIVEHFDLPEGEYTPESLFEAYSDSIWDEANHDHKMLFHILKKGVFEFSEDNHLNLTLDDTTVAHQSEDDIKNLISMIFTDRCGVPVTVSFIYRDPGESRYKADAQRKIENRVMEIENEVNRAKLAKEASESDGEGEKDPAQKAEGSKSAGNDNNSKGNGKDQYGNKTFEKGRRPLSLVRSSKPNVIYGRDFADTPIPIADTEDPIGVAAVMGEVISIEITPIKNEREIFTFVLCDDTDSIKVKLFLQAEQSKTFQDTLKKGMFVSVKGEVVNDTFEHEIVIGSVKGIMTISDFRIHRMDKAEHKRVELHAHTKMSDMDSVADVGKLISTAKRWGHKAVAITDHAVVQSFPDADHALKGDDDIKVIYGMEAYVVDDTKPIAVNEAGQTLDDSFVVFDIETTGLNCRKCKIIEIGAVRYSGGKLTDRFSEFVNPNEHISPRITELTSITDADVKDADTIDKVLPRFIEFCGSDVLVAHNADFDTGCMIANSLSLGIDWKFTHIDTIPLAKFLFPELHRYGLDDLNKRCNVVNAHHHRAIDDAEATAQSFAYMINELKERGINDLKDLNEKGVFTDENIIKEMHQDHCILLAKNDLGRINLYHLVSRSHQDYLTHMAPKKPVLPKSLIQKYREGLIVGSACEEGQLYDTLKLGKADQEVERVASFYDYFEVQPISNNPIYLNDNEADKYFIYSEEDLRDITRRIIGLGEKHNKPVVATSDVHMIEPEDRIYREVILDQRKRMDGEKDVLNYFRTTDEMLEEFSFLGFDKAYEIVVKNTNMIADMCERIHPTRPDKCPPVIENSDETLRKICYNKVHDIYGEDVPEVVSARLERELNSIISNGYAVMYIIAQKLVWKSNEDGYLVGSRGSVGSSFVATMAGISEVNPLQAHYLCTNCHYTDFDSELVKSYAGRSGCDLPDQICPVCGKPLSKEGNDIPFETFLGFKGNKEPDIDLNFSSEYLNKAHRYTEVIFGEGQTYRAGTVGTVAEKTAVGFVKGYFEKRDMHRRRAELERLAVGCDGVRRTTGQHPGGIIVLPMGEEIDSFTPIQHPANKDMDTFTTHFDYHKIDSNLLKLDILGKDDPTQIRMLQDMTGVDPLSIPLDDKDVLSLFLNTKALGVEPEQLWHADRGTFGIPEFGTDNAMGMLRDTQPREFSDLVRISGLSHGTGVWKGNAQDLILDGKATISTAICTRDDIMIYLISMGLDSEESFKIMEAVRKGQVAKGKCDKWPEWKQDMIDHKVPDWYIWSCEQIEYMFPKAHAAAYVMMAWRLAYFKINYPLEYYAAFFTIKDKTYFDYELMCQGQAAIEGHLSAFDKRKEEERFKKSKSDNKITPAEEEQYQVMRRVHEMYARGFEFAPIDLYESDYRYFKVKDGKLLPPLSVISGFGESAAEQLKIAAEQGQFTSRQDLKTRGKIGAKTMEILDRLGLIDDLPETSQLSLLDMMRQNKQS